MTKTLNSNEEFLKAISSIIETKIINEYRAYYDNTGKVIFFAANQFPETGDWITITRDTYVTHNYTYLWVVDGNLITRIPNSKYYFPLTRSNKGVKVVKYHAGLVLEPGETYENIEHYDRRTN